MKLIFMLDRADSDEVGIRNELARRVVSEGYEPVGKAIRVEADTIKLGTGKAEDVFKVVNNAFREEYGQDFEYEMLAVSSFRRFVHIKPNIIMRIFGYERGPVEKKYFCFQPLI